MTISTNTQDSTLLPSDKSEQVIGTSPHRGEAAPNKRRLKLEIIQQFDANVLPFIRGDVKKQRGNESGDR